MNAVAGVGGVAIHWIVTITCFDGNVFFTLQNGK